VARIKEIESGNKATLPIVYTENANGKGSWRAKGFGDNRCLYNEQKLAGSDKPVLIVEGEKTAEVAQKLYPELDVVSWSGGANAYKQTNWSVLQGKDVTIWPDNDKPGMNAAKAISDILKQHDTKARIIDPSTIGRFPTKWDLADKLPDDIHKHQITGAILDTVSINKDSRIEKTVNEYMDYRWSKKQKALQNKKFDNFGEFIAAKLQLEAKLKTEEIFAKEALEHNPVISNVDSVFISLKANKAINNTNKVNSLLPSSSHEQIKDAMILSLKSQFNKESASIIRNTANASLDYTYKFIAEHNSMHEPTHFIHNNKASYIALSLASEMLHNQLDVNHHKDYSSINNIKQSFNKRVENEMIHFDQHNQYMQNQMHKQQQTEI
jgi:DNA primase